MDPRNYIRVVPYDISLESDNKEALHCLHHCTTSEAGLNYSRNTLEYKHLWSVFSVLMSINKNLHHKLLRWVCSTNKLKHRILKGKSHHPKKKTLIKKELTVNSVTWTESAIGSKSPASLYISRTKAMHDADFPSLYVQSSCSGMVSSSSKDDPRFSVSTNISGRSRSCSKHHS